MDLSGSRSFQPRSGISSAHHRGGHEHAFLQPAHHTIAASICTQEACSRTFSTPTARPSSRRDLPAGPDAFLDAIKPFRQGLVVGCECMFAWYWLADLCEDTRIPFVLGHALYMKAIHGGKAKNDRIDAGKIAGLLRGGMFPLAYVYPRAKRETRDLLRRRTFFVQQRAQLIAHISEHQQPVQPAAASTRSSPMPARKKDSAARRSATPI